MGHARLLIGIHSPLVQLLLLLLLLCCAAVGGLDKSDFMGRTIHVNEARPREERPPRQRSFGGGGGWGGSRQRQQNDDWEQQ